MTASDRSAAWRDGAIVDRWPRPRGLAGLLAALAMLVVAADLLVAAIADADGREIPLAGPSTLRERLTDAAADGDAAVLLIGDSVLAGDVLAAHDDAWDERRVIDYMARELAPTADARFHQVALDGLLPVDIERIVDELDRADPGAEVRVVVELNLRYFSPHYAASAACTRPWLCDLGDGEATPGLRQLAAAPIRALHEATTPWLPVARHRERLALGDRLSEATAPLAVMRTKVARERRQTAAQARARHLEHYRESDLSDDSTQIAALERALASIARSGRDATFFTTPVNEAVIDAFARPGVAGARYAALSERIRQLDPAGERLRLVELDHPLFAAEHFIDHCHLLPEGNRLLAINLLHELNLGLARRPRASEVIRRESQHRTLVGQLPQGYAEGPAWEALFREPSGIAWDEAGHQLVVADTGNHVLRRLGGALQTVELLAGTPTVAGNADGPAATALLRRPRAPCVTDGAVFFIDGLQRVLRQVRDGAVTTVPGVPRGLRALRCRDDQVLGLSTDSKIHVLDLDDSSVRSYAFKLADDAGTRPRLQTFALCPGRQLFAATRDNKILQGELGDATTVPLTTVFANTGEDVIPRERKRKFPYTFDELRFANIRDLAYVERYGGLLIQDEAPLAKRIKGKQKLTERILLRFLDLEERKVYPWIKPEVYGQSYVMWNANSDSPVSGVHLGSMALDPHTASLFYLERERSRLYRIDDGLLGLAKTGHFGGGTAKPALHDRLGRGIGRVTLKRFRPHDHLDARWLDQPRSGPYVGLLIGSSMSSYNDIVGEYSLGRKIEQVLTAELGYRDRLRFDLFHVTSPGISIAGMIESIKTREALGLRADVILLEIALLDRFIGDSDEAAFVGLLRDLAALRRTSGALVLFLDNTAMGTRYVDSMRAPGPQAARAYALIRGAGFPIVEPGDRLVQRGLDYSTWGNQPWSRKRFMHHGSIWSIEITGELFAELLYPKVRAHLVDHEPRQRRPAEAPAAAATDTGALVIRAIEGAPFTRDDLPAIDREAVQIRYTDGHLQIFLDRRRVPEDASEAAAALAAIYDALEGDVYGGFAVRVSVEIAAFESYDEYGAGALSTAKILWKRSLNRDRLAALIAEVAAALPQAGTGAAQR